MKITSRLMTAVSVFALAVSLACGGGGGGGGGSASTPPTPQTQLLTITTAPSLPVGLQGHAYSTTLSASGGQGALHWSIAPISSTALFVNGLAMDANTGVLSGTANFAGTAGFVATVTDSGAPAQTANRTFTVTANGLLSVAAANTLSPLQYLSFPVNLFFSGGVPPFTYSFDPSCLPPGMKPGAKTGNGSDLIIVGAALTAGTFVCTIAVSDSFSPPELAKQTLTLTVQVQNLQFGSSLPPKLLLNRPVSGRAIGIGGVPPYSYALQSGTLPPGLLFDASTGHLSGTPTSLGTFTFALQVTDSSSPKQIQLQFFSVPVVQPVGRNDRPATATPMGNGTSSASISPYIDPPNGTPAAGDQDYYGVQSLGGAVVHAQTSILGQNPLDTVIEIVDGNGVQFSTCRQPGDTSTNFNTGCVNDDVRPGILDSALDFQVPGPTSTLAKFYVHVLDFRGDARPDMTYSLDISGAATPLQITTPSSMGAVLGFGFGRLLSASGGTGHYSWFIPSGALPPGITFDGSGLLTGTLTTAGTYVFDVRVDDSGPPPQSATETISFTVGAPLQVTTTSLPQGKVGTPYSAAITTTGGVAPLAFTLNGGALPPGLALGSTTGIISGTPTATGSFFVIVAVQDVAQQQQFQVLTIVVNP